MPRIMAAPAFIAIGCLVPVSAWWFASLQGVGGDAAGFVSQRALQIALLLQSLAICLFAPQWAANVETPGDRGRQQGLDVAASVAAAVVPAWPLLAMLCLASAVPAGRVGVFQFVLLLAGAGLVWLAAHLGRRIASANAVHTLRVSLGVGLAGIAFAFREPWLAWVLS